MKSGSSQNRCWGDAYGQDRQQSKRISLPSFKDSCLGGGREVLGECLCCFWCVCARHLCWDTSGSCQVRADASFSEETAVQGREGTV